MIATLLRIAAAIHIALWAIGGAAAAVVVGRVLFRRFKRWTRS